MSMSTPRSWTWYGHEVFEKTWRGHGHGHGHGHAQSEKRGVDLDMYMKRFV